MSHPNLQGPLAIACLLAGISAPEISKAQSTPGQLVLLAGGLGGNGNINGKGSAARFNDPEVVTVDKAGHVYVADSQNDVIRKVTPAGVVTTFAGATGVAGSADGTGSAAEFNQPAGIAIDPAGDLYVSDSSNNTLRKVTAAGVVTTLAGVAGQRGANDGTGSSARFSYPWGLAVASNGMIYVADSGNGTIRKVTPRGVVSTIAGTVGMTGSADGTGRRASFNAPSSIAVDSSGNLYVADSENDTVRKVTAAGVVTTLAGTPGVCAKADGTGSAARFCIPQGVALDSAGNILVTDSDNSTIRSVTPAGVVTTLAGTAGKQGSADGTGIAASFGFPFGIAIGHQGSIYISDNLEGTIRKMTAANVVTTLAGYAARWGVTNGTGSAARFNSPTGLAVDSTNNVYVADDGNNVIRKVTPAGVVTTFARSTGVTPGGTVQSEKFKGPEGIAVDSAGNVYVADFDDNTIRKITPAGTVSLFAGMAGQSGTTDGTGNAARFNEPYGVAVDAAGNVYVADSYNDTLRKITPAGVVTTLAGNPGVPGSADGTGSSAGFNLPQGVAVDSAGNVFVVDAKNETIRKVTPAGVVTTVAGSPGETGNADGVGSAARFHSPQWVGVDSSDNLYVADGSNDAIRKITPSGQVTTVVGAVGSEGVALEALPASLAFLGGLAVLPSGDLILSSENSILKAELSGE